MEKLKTILSKVLFENFKFISISPFSKQHIKSLRFKCGNQKPQTNLHTLKILTNSKARLKARNLFKFFITTNRVHNSMIIKVQPYILYSSLIVGGILINPCSRIPNNFSLFHLAKCNDSAELKYFLDQGSSGNVNERHPLGWTALHVAAVNGKSENVKILLQAGADINAGDKFSNIYRTAIEKEMNTLDVIMQREEEFNNKISSQITYTGFTALHYAVLSNNLEVVRILLQAGANPTIENSTGHLPLKYAFDEEIKNLLSTYTTKFLELEELKKAEERQKFPLDQRLKLHIIGQEMAISNVAAAICRKENGWTDNQHPLVFLFLGSSGIGKTELGKQLANYLHENKPDALIRIDMSEYQEKHEVAKLIGAPPGYVGYNDGGQLTKKLKQCPNAIVLFDEVDKAHPDVLTVLLQLFDEGRLTDGKGKTIDCKDAIFVMTSNLGADEIAKQAPHLRKQQKSNHAALSKIKKWNNFSGEKYIEKNDAKLMRDFKNKIIQPILKEHFRRDEFLGRINEIVYFLPFTPTELNQLVSKELDFWAEKAFEKHKIKLKWIPEVETLIAEGYDAHYGVRSIKYEVERCIVSKIAAAHEKGVISKGSNVELIVKQAKDNDGNQFPIIALHIEKDGKILNFE